MRYEVIFASYAAEPPAGSKAGTGRQGSTPCARSHRASDLQPSDDRWTSHLGDWGVIEYTVHSAVVRVVCSVSPGQITDQPAPDSRNLAARMDV